MVCLSPFAVTDDPAADGYVSLHSVAGETALFRCLLSADRLGSFFLKLPFSYFIGNCIPMK